MYGIAFIILGNLSGNAIAFGIYVMNAAGHSKPEKGPVIGLAIGVVTFASLLHIFSRRGSILINNGFAMLKIAILLAIFVLGMIKASGNTLGGEPKATSNFDPDKSFNPLPYDVPSFSNSFLYIVYTYSGF